MFKESVVVLLIVCIILATSGCIGSFTLTRQVYHWNAGLGKIGGELVFLAFVILPVYSITMIGDALIFNTIQFWGGGTVIDPPSGDLDGIFADSEW
jgi:hypothetical protein